MLNRSEYFKEYRRKNKEKLNEYHKNYYHLNKNKNKNENFKSKKKK